MLQVEIYIAVAAGALLLAVILYFCCKPSSKSRNGVIDFTQVFDVVSFRDTTTTSPLLRNKATSKFYGGGPGESKLSLNIIILTIGTRGDVQPFVALCKALKKAGHNPLIASHGCFKDWVTSNDIEFQDIGSHQINQPTEWLTATSIADFFEAMKPEIEKSKIACEYFYEAAKGKDLIVATSHTVSFGLDISEKLNIPCVAIKLAPDIPTKAFGPFSKESSQYGICNLINHYIFLISVARAYKSTGMDTMEEDFRENVLKLPRGFGTKRITDIRDMPTIVAIGKDIVPDPKWPNNVSISGWLFLDDEKFKPSAEVQAFLKDKSPPVCVNFGSMVLASKSGLISNALKAVRASGYRVLLIAGWAKPPGDCDDIISDTSNCLVVKGLPHEWIFPRCACIIHHGGAGTLARALQSGVPSIIVPILKWADQSFWARIVQERNLGIHVKDRNVDEKALKNAIEMATTSKKIHDSCTQMKSCIRGENSGEDIVKMLEMVHFFFSNK